MKLVQPVYHVQSIEPLWLRGEGFIAGLPVCRVVAREKSSKQTESIPLNALMVRLRKIIPHPFPRVLFAAGDQRGFDATFIHGVHHHLKMSVYTEIDGRSAMNDRHGEMPIYDHVCIRLASPRQPIADGILLHSVIVQSPCDARDLIALSDELDKQGWKIPRFIAADSADGVSDEDAKLASQVAYRLWRVTHPMYHKSIGKQPAKKLRIG